MDISSIETLALRVALKQGHVDLMAEHGFQNWIRLTVTPQIVDHTIQQYLARTIQAWDEPIVLRLTGAFIWEGEEILVQEELPPTVELGYN